MRKVAVPTESASCAVPVLNCVILRLVSRSSRTRLRPVSCTSACPVAASEELIAFVKRQVDRRIEPVGALVLGTLITDLAFDQADARDVKDALVSDHQRAKRSQGDE